MWDGHAYLVEAAFPEISGNYSWGAFRNCFFSRSNREAVEITRGELLMENCLFTLCGNGDIDPRGETFIRSAIDLEGTWAAVGSTNDGTVIRNCNFIGNFIAISVDESHSPDITLENLIIYDGRYDNAGVDHGGGGNHYIRNFDEYGKIGILYYDGAIADDQLPSNSCIFGARDEIDVDLTWWPVVRMPQSIEWDNFEVNTDWLDGRDNTNQDPFFTDDFFDLTTAITFPEENNPLNEFLFERDLEIDGEDLPFEFRYDLVDMHLKFYSACVNAGLAGAGALFQDPDGSPTNIGMFGGPRGDDFADRFDYSGNGGIDYTGMPYCTIPATVGPLDRYHTAEFDYPYPGMVEDPAWWWPVENPERAVSWDDIEFGGWLWDIPIKFDTYHGGDMDLDRVDIENIDPNFGDITLTIEEDAAIDAGQQFSIVGMVDANMNGINKLIIESSDVAINNISGIQRMEINLPANNEVLDIAGEVSLTGLLDAVTNDTLFTSRLFVQVGTVEIGGDLNIDIGREVYLQSGTTTQILGDFMMERYHNVNANDDPEGFHLLQNATLRFGNDDSRMILTAQESYDGNC